MAIREIEVVPEGADDEVYLPLPATERLTKAIRAIWRRYDWGVLAMVSGGGKSMSALHVIEESGAIKRSDGFTRMPAILGRASGRTNANGLLRSLGRAVGLRHVTSPSQLMDRLPAQFARVGVSLVIVGEGHNLEMQQWKDLVVLHNAYKEEHGRLFALVATGVKFPSLYGADTTEPIAQQIHRRLSVRAHIGGHTGGEVKTALRLICDRYAPDLSASLPGKASTITKGLAARGLAQAGDVPSKPLVQLVRVHIAPAHAEHPAAPLNDLIESALDEMHREWWSVHRSAPVLRGASGKERPSDDGDESE